MRGVATNVHLWKTSEKPKETSKNENSNFGSYFTFEEGISTSYVCLKGQQPILEL